MAGIEDQKDEILSSLDSVKSGSARRRAILLTAHLASETFDRKNGGFLSEGEMKAILGAFISESDNAVLDTFRKEYYRLNDFVTYLDEKLLEHEKEIRNLIKIISLYLYYNHKDAIHTEGSTWPLMYNEFEEFFNLIALDLRHNRSELKAAIKLFHNHMKNNKLTSITAYSKQVKRIEKELKKPVSVHLGRELKLLKSSRDSSCKDQLLALIHSIAPYDSIPLDKIKYDRLGRTHFDYGR